MIESLLAILTLLTILLAAFGLGRPVVRALRLGEVDALTAGVWSVAVGLVVGGLGWAVLGLAGGLSKTAVGIVSLAAAFWGLGEIALAHRAALLRKFEGDESEALDEDEPAESQGGGPPTWLIRGMLLLAGVVTAASLFGALAPPTDADALCRHLELPKQYLAEGSLCWAPYHDGAGGPLLAEMWYLWAMALAGPEAAQLVHWACGVLLALAAVVLTRPVIGDRWAWIVGALVLLVPGVNHQMTAPLNDVALALLATLALAAWRRAVVDDEGRHWFVLAGLAAGGALGTRALALVFAVAVGVTWAWALIRQPTRRRVLLEGAAVVAVIAIGVGGLWYARAAWHQSNPVHLVVGELVHGGSIESGSPEAVSADNPTPMGRGLLGLLAAPWEVTMRPERFGGRTNQVGAIFLAVLPGLFFARRLRGLGSLLAVAGAYGLIWFLLRQDVRWLLPIVPLLSVGVVWVWIETRRLPLAVRGTVGGMQAVVLVFLTATVVVYGWRCLPVAVGLEDRQHYLAEHEPGYPSAVLANVILGPNDHLLTQENRLFYFNVRTTQELAFRHKTRYPEKIARPINLGRLLREAGFTHILVVEEEHNDGFVDRTLAQLANADPSIVFITKCFATNADGRLRRYRLMKLGD
ncbi:MAG: phospholipid carrier-dependent glycosyltransferase [Pirellulales bacterium]|nr:phospholipid carrier-dependent glycosyltransferase [Pirellulales bacterium]